MKILLLGDSIRCCYQDEVKQQLGDAYEVFAPEENCRFSLYVLNSLRFWLNAFPTPDVIHFNAGLWDTAILYHEDGCFIDVEHYVHTMKQILRELKKTGAKIIFATITPVSDEKDVLPGPMPPAHRNEDILRYNQAVLEAFRGEDLVINDLWSAMYAEKDAYLLDDMIHPNDAGVKLLGTLVANTIKECGACQNEKTTEQRTVTNDPKQIQ